MSVQAESQPVLIAGEWRASSGSRRFHAVNPLSRQSIPTEFPLSSWEDCDRALDAAATAFELLRQVPEAHIAAFLEHYAAEIEERAAAIAAQAHLESGLALSPRLRDVELPRTVNQLRQAADAARDGSWRMPTIDSRANIRSYLAPIGPVAVFGPSNFPLAFGSVSGGDFAAAIAAGNPVIAKAHPQHPGTARLLAEAALDALNHADLPCGAVQLIYNLDREDGKRLVSDPRIAATAFTGSRSAGLALKQVADQQGKLTFLELSSVNPVVILPGAIAERATDIAEELCASALLGAGQFCTNPGLVLMLAGEETEAFISLVARRFDGSPPGTLISAGTLASLEASVESLRQAGAVLATEAVHEGRSDFSRPNTLLRASARQFLEAPAEFQTEAFGNASLVVVADDVPQLEAVIGSLEGNLTGCVYSAENGRDDMAYDRLADALRLKVGRLLNDKMPTGVAVSPAMHHGGPFPATGHPHFTAVGIPASLRRFAMLQCFDGVRPRRLPPALRDENPGGLMWRQIDGQWTRDSVQQAAHMK